MKVTNLHNKLITLPPAIEFTIFLIREELKANKLFSTLQQVGLDGSYCRSDYSSIILENVGFTGELSNDVLDFYFVLLQTYGKKVSDDDAKTTRQAFKFYIDLIIEKRKRIG